MNRTSRRARQEELETGWERLDVGAAIATIIRLRLGHAGKNRLLKDTF